jgi:hypothetical protein
MSLFRDLIAGLRQGVGPLYAAQRRNRGERDTLAAETTMLHESPAPRDEQAQNLRTLVERTGAVNPEHGAAWRRTVSGSIAPDGTVQPPAFPDDITLGLMGIAPTWLYAACRLQPEAVIAGILRMIESAPPAAAGPPMAERPARLRAIAERVAELEIEHRELVEAAAEVGVQLEHLPVERARQARAAAGREAHELHERINARAITRHEREEAARAAQRQQAEREAAAREQAEAAAGHSGGKE